MSSNRETPVSPTAVVFLSLYTAAQMVANVASLKIGVVAGLAVDMGTFIYPVTFTLRDLVHKTVGRKNARVLVVVAGLVNLFMAAYLLFASMVPDDSSWGLGEQFRAIFSPVWRLVIASIGAQIASELADTEVYHWFVTKVTKRMKWLRVLVSNSVSVPLDTAVFSLGAFAFALSWGAVLDIFLMNFFVKFGITLLSLPLIYIGRDKDLD